MSDEIWAQRPRFVTADPDRARPAPIPRSDAFVPSRPPGAPYGAWTVTRKEPALSLVASYFVPGLGSMINGNIARGLWFMAGVLLLPWVPLILALVALTSDRPVPPAVSFIFLGVAGLVFLGVWVWSIFDAYREARAYNSAHGHW